MRKSFVLLWVLCVIVAFLAGCSKKEASDTQKDLRKDFGLSATELVDALKQDALTEFQFTEPPDILDNSDGIREIYSYTYPGEDMRLMQIFQYKDTEKVYCVLVSSLLDHSDPQKIASGEVYLTTVALAIARRLDDTLAEDETLAKRLGLLELESSGGSGEESGFYWSTHDTESLRTIAFWAEKAD